MAGNRSRDLMFSILSDASKFDAAAPARDLDDLAGAADTAGASLADLDAARERVDLDRLGKDAKDTARKVDSAFDAIARSSKTAERKLDTNTREMRGSFRDVRDEAADTGREMGASFTGGVDDLQGAVQELAANAGVAFGPVGIAAGVAASVGVGLIRAQAEELKTLASEMVEEMVDAGGRLTAEVINAKILARATDDPGAFTKEKRVVEELGLVWNDYARAKAGDPKAAKRSIQQIADASTKLTEQAAAAGSASGAMYTQQTALNQLSGELGLTAEAYRIAEEATGAIASSTDHAAGKTDTMRDSWETARGVMADPITGEVKLNTPSPGRLSGIRRDLADGIGPIIVDVIPRRKGTELFYPNSRRRP